MNTFRLVACFQHEIPTELHLLPDYKIRQNFPLEMALNIHEKGFTTAKNMRHFVSPSFLFGAKMSYRRLALSLLTVARQDNSFAIFI